MRAKLFFTVIVLFATMSLYAQKYKDIFPQIISADQDNSFEILNSFLINNLDHPNANLRVALIYTERYKATDVLRNHERAIALAEQAKTKLFKSKIVLNEKDVKKNSEYYFGLANDGGAPVYSELSNLIIREEQMVAEFLEKAPVIFTQFTNSVEKYDQAVKSFAEIVGFYGSLKELYLLYDDSLKQQLAFLKENYDSTKVYFDNYLQLRQEYKLNAVSQTYSENTINVYRLDGLVTQINFLEPKIVLWNYASWADSVNSVISETIDGLREDLYDNEKKLRLGVEEANKTINTDSFKVVHTDKALVFNLLKYDYKNAIVPLLLYYEFKQQFIIDLKRKSYFDTASISIDRRLAYYSDMMYDSKLGDSIITQFESRFNPQQLLRHKAFIEDVFGDADTMKDYMDEQKEENNKVFLDQVANIKAGVLSIGSQDSIAGIVKFRKVSIPAYIIDDKLSELPAGQIKTQYLLSSADESLYIAGLQVTDKKNLNQEIALAKLSPELKPLWVKNIDLEIDSAGVDANHWLGDVILTSEGVALIIRSVSLDSSKVMNTLIHFTEDGQIKFIKKLKTELYPREINFIEANNMFVITFFGQQKMMDPQINSDLSVLTVNGLGQDIWQYDYSFKGDYVNMINTNNGFLIGGNYSLIKNKAGRTFSKSSGNNAYVLSLSSIGALNDIKCLTSDSDYLINTFYKVNENNINLIGTKGEQIIINADLKEIYSSVMMK